MLHLSYCSFKFMTEQKHKRSNTNPEEVTFRDLVLKTKEYFFELVHNWKWILFAGLSIMIILGVRSSMKSPVYKASLSFMIELSICRPGYPKHSHKLFYFWQILFVYLRTEIFWTNNFHNGYYI